jgi:hypothetical protein
MTETIRIQGLGNLDAVELQDLLSSTGISVEGTAHPPGKLQEIGTITLVLGVTIPALGVLAAWLLKPRQFRELNLDLEIERSDGTRTRVKLGTRSSSEEPPSEEIIDKISSITQMPADQLRAAMPQIFT